MLNRYLKALLIFFAGLFLCLSVASCEQLNPSDSDIDSKILKRGNGADVETLDPQLARSESALTIVRDLYEGLVRQEQNGDIVPAIAREWVKNADDQCIHFTLREDAKWSNGDPLVAQDFIRGWTFALDAKNAAPYAELLLPFSNRLYDDKAPTELLQAKAIDEQTLALCLPYFASDLLARLTLPIFFPRHKDYATDNIISNGAYQLQERVPQAHVRVSKNQNYYAKQSVYFNQVDFITSEDAHSELKRYLAGELDVTATIPSTDVERLQKKYTDDINIAPVLNTYFYGFNLKAEPFNDNVKLRKALSLAVDRELLVSKVLGSGEQAAWTLVPPMIANYDSFENPDSLLNDNERILLAKQLYQEAGYSISKPAQFELRYNTSPLHKKIALALASMWKQHLGVEVELYNEEWKVFVQNRRSGNTQMFRSGWIADVNDANNYLQLFSANGSLNDYRYSNIEYTTNLNRALIEPQERVRLLVEAEKMLTQDYAIIPLYYYVSKHMVRSELEGWEDNVLDIHLSQYLSRTEEK